MVILIVAVCQMIVVVQILHLKQALLQSVIMTKNWNHIPQSSILGVGCGAPLNFANLKEGETVVDLGSGAGIDAFLSF